MTEQEKTRRRNLLDVGITPFNYQWFPACENLGVLFENGETWYITKCKPGVVHFESDKGQKVLFRSSKIGHQEDGDKIMAMFYREFIREWSEGGGYTPLLDAVEIYFLLS